MINAQLWLEAGLHERVSNVLRTRCKQVFNKTSLRAIQKQQRYRFVHEFIFSQKGACNWFASHSRQFI